MRSECTVCTSVSIEQHAPTDVQLPDEALDLHSVVTLRDAHEVDTVAVAMTQPLHHRQAFAAWTTPCCEEVDDRDAPGNMKLYGLSTGHRRERQRRQRITDQDSGEKNEEHEVELTRRRDLAVLVLKRAVRSHDRVEQRPARGADVGP